MDEIRCVYCNSKQCEPTGKVWTSTEGTFELTFCRRCGARFRVLKKEYEPAALEVIEE